MLDEIVLGALFVVQLLQGAVELKQVHDIVKVLHEFLVVDLAVPIHICKQVQGKAFLDGKSKFLNLQETGLVFVPFKEAIRVAVTLSEN